MDAITEIGLGGALVIAMGIIKDVVTRLLGKKNGNGRESHESAGSQSKEFWQMEFKQMEDRICRHHAELVKESDAILHAVEGRIMKRLDDLYAAMQTLIRWKGGD